MTLFALILVTGIVIDATIIVVENMHRHFQMKGNNSLRTALDAIQEVGNPTILATLTVIASMMPMAFVRGLMGPYMRPMPIGASLAMVFSLLVALTISPWLAIRLLKPQAALARRHGGRRHASKGEGADSYSLHTTPIYKTYNRLVRPLVESPRKGVLALLVVAVLTAASTLLFVTRTVQVKMLPFDNKSEFQVIIDTPEGTTLETTTQLAREIGDYLATVPEVTDYQIYAGTAAPVNFSGLVRHYMMRQGPNVADIQVNLVDKGQRDDQSHALAKRVRGPIKEIGRPLRRRRQGGRGAARPAGAVDPGGRGLRAHLRGPHGRRPADQGGLRHRPPAWWTSTGTWRTTRPATTWWWTRSAPRCAGSAPSRCAMTLGVALSGHDAGLAAPGPGRRAGAHQRAPAPGRPLQRREPWATSTSTAGTARWCPCPTW